MRDDLVSQIAQLSPKLQSELAILKTHDEKVKALEEQLDEHGGVQLQSARFAVSSAKTELAAAEEHSAQLAAQMTAAERAVAKTERALAAAATELADIKAQIEQISTDMKEMEAAAFAVMTRVTAVQQQCAGLAEQVQAKEKVYSKARKAFDKIRAGIVDIEEKELEARKALEEARAVIAKYQHETTFYGKKLADAVAAHRSLGADVPESELTESPEALLAPVNRESMAEINDRILTAEADAKSKNTKANAKAIASYKTKADEHAACLVQLEKASEARRNAVTELDQLQKRRLMSSLLDSLRSV
jgi:chromosome segregation ATPase